MSVTSEEWKPSRNESRTAIDVLMERRPDGAAISGSSTRRSGSPSMTTSTYCAVFLPSRPPWVSRYKAVEGGDIRKCDYSTSTRPMLMMLACVILPYSMSLHGIVERSQPTFFAVAKTSMPTDSMLGRTLSM